MQKILEIEPLNTIAKQPNPRWPKIVKEALRSAQEETPEGCGGCMLAEWFAEECYDKQKDETYIAFRLGVCRGGVVLEKQQPAIYCTLANSIPPIE